MSAVNKIGIKIVTIASIRKFENLKKKQNKKTKKNEINIRQLIKSGLYSILSTKVIMVRTEHTHGRTAM